MRLTIGKMCNVTHFLLVIRQDVVVPFRKMSNVTHQLVNIENYILELPLRKMCNVTHKLVVIGQDVMILVFRICAMSLTVWWS